MNVSAPRITPFLITCCFTLLFTSCNTQEKDTVPPKVSISYPVSGSKVHGNQRISISAKDESGVKKVSVWIDGKKRIDAESSDKGYEAYWNTTDEPDSSIHSLVAEAVDYLENIGKSDSVRVMCYNKGIPPVQIELDPDPVTTKHSVFLSWEPSIDREFDHYLILRTVDSLWNEYDTIARLSNIHISDYEDPGYNLDSVLITPWGLDEGVTYYYKLGVFDTLSLSAWSEPISAITRSIKPVIIQNASEIEKYSLRLNWTLQDDDYRYHRIYASTSPNVGRERDTVGVVDGRATSFKITGLKSGTKYYFRVGSVDSAWKSVKSLAINTSTTPFDTLELEQPSGDEISKYSIELHWEQTYMKDFLKYSVYRGRNSGVDTTDVLVGNIFNREQTYIQDEDLLPATKYYYKVFLFDSTGNHSPSNEISATTKVIQKSVLQVGNVHKYKVELIWSESQEPDFSHYTLCRSHTPGFDSSSADLKVRIDSKTTTTYTDNSVNYNTAYYYKLYVTDLKGYSAVDSVDVTTLNFVPPELTKMVAINDQHFQISWIEYEDAITFKQYYLYRDTIPDVDRSYSSLVTTIDNRSDTTYLDQSAELVQYQPYYYRLYVLDIRDNMSTGSNILGDVLNSAPIPVTLYNPLPEEITSNSIPLTWSRNQNDDFWKFELYMSFSEQIEPDDNQSTLVATLGDTTQYTVHNLQPGLVYYFRIFVVDLGNEYSGSNVIYGVTKP